MERCFASVIPKDNFLEVMGGSPDLYGIDITWKLTDGVRTGELHLTLEYYYIFTRSLLDLYNSRVCVVCDRIDCGLDQRLHEGSALHIRRSRTHFRLRNYLLVLVPGASDGLGCHQILWLSTRLARDAGTLRLCSDNLDPCLGALGTPI